MQPSTTKIRSKFSFDVWKLKTGSSKEVFRERILSPALDSRPPTPQSVRPPLPEIVDAELRAACAYIVTHPRPSHQVWADQQSKPALDCAAVKAGGESLRPFPVRKSSVKTNGQTIEVVELQKHGSQPSESSRDAWNNQQHKEQPQVLQVWTRPHADQPVASSVVQTARGGHRRPTVNLPTQRCQPFQNARPTRVVEKNEDADRARTSTRSDSVRTIGSTPHTDSTDYPWSASTTLTSPAMTPARSKRASSQNVPLTSESASVPKYAPADLERVRQELESYQVASQVRGRRDVDHITRSPVLPNAATVVEVPTRKPVPSNLGGRQPSGSVHQASVSDTGVGPAESAIHSIPLDALLQKRGRQARTSHRDEDDKSRGRVPARSRSRLGKAARAASQAASRAAIRAGNIANEVFGHQAEPNEERDSRSLTSPLYRSGQMASDIEPRSSSRARNMSGRMKSYIRSVSRPRRRKSSTEAAQGHNRMDSTNSYFTSDPEADQSDHLRQYTAWPSLEKNLSDISAPPGDKSGHLASTGSERKAKVIDLNRDLPPLPSLGRWQTDEIEFQSPKAEGVSQPRQTRSPKVVAEDGRRPLWRQDKKSRAEQLNPP